MNLFCTVVTRSHAPYVLALSESLVASGNVERLNVLVADADAGTLPPDGDHVRFLAFTAVEAGLPARVRQYFDAFELCNALKPFLVSLLFKEGAQKVIYLDSDLLVAGSFNVIWDGFGPASLQLTPHRLTPPSLQEPAVNEIEIVDMGFLNGGFSAWRAGEAAERMLDWLRTRLPVYGFCDRPHGMFVDQKLMPLLLQYFPDDVKILRHPGLNVASWNARERDVRPAPGGGWMIGDTPVIFFHLSGYRIAEPGVPCTYLPREVNTAMVRASPWLAPVMAAYHERLTRHFAGHTTEPYAYNTFEGVRLTKEFRRLIFRTGGLDRSSRDFWRVWFRERLRAAKQTARRFTAHFRS